MTTRPKANTKRRATQPIDTPEALVGRVIDGRFRLVEVLSCGGMGIVFEATQLSVGRQIAVKILRPTLSEEADLVERFSQEIEAVAALHHPNVVSLIDAGRDAGGLTYLAMEYVEGNTFRQALKNSELSLGDIIEVFVQTCDALIEAHAADIIHRDLKFDNIMLSRHRDVRLHIKILDFGVAKLLSKNLHLTRNGQVPGTPGIIAPELIDEQPPTARSDLYSLGVLLYTALAGEAPFQGSNDLELMRAHKFDEVPRLEPLIGPAVPDALVDLTYAMLEKQPQRRPEDAREARDRLEVIGGRLRQADIPAVYDPAASIDTFGVPERSQQQPRPLVVEDIADWPSARPPASADEPLFEQFVRAFFGRQPVVAPATVVVILAILLLVLLSVILYMFVPKILGLAAGA